MVPTATASSSGVLARGRAKSAGVSEAAPAAGVCVHPVESLCRIRWRGLAKDGPVEGLECV